MLGKRTADKWECRTPKRTRISRWDEGDLALREAHPLCHHQDILITQIFTKLDWEGQAAVQMVCKQWRSLYHNTSPHHRGKDLLQLSILIMGVSKPSTPSLHMTSHCHRLNQVKDTQYQAKHCRILQWLED
ncbi:uncharacterized protein [Spinacia oleracea]|uniref:F-box domain-containing protein n=1 Tax=Spinacia oleracea TaxID=3562 RepID=A0ABM3QN47_SPIOL|nr:uncharacterized protein LOC130460953 [Spinacia oleracea]